MSKPSTFIHEKALVDTKNIGQDSKVWEFTHILEGARIGNNCNICSHCFIENDVIIGNNVTIKCGVYLWDGLRIEDNAFIGPNATFTNDLFPRSKNYPENFPKTVIQEGASIGANSTVLCGLTIGRYSLTGAGSVITKDVMPYTIVIGNPGKQKGYICKCGNKLDSMECSSCGVKYQMNKENIISEIST